MKTKVGLLIDLNAFPRFPKEEDYFNDENLPFEDGFSSVSVSSSADLFSTDSRLDAKLKILEEFILEQLTRDGTVRGNFSSTDFQFTYRFYNSATYSHPTKELRTFMSFDVASFEGFEKTLEAEVRNLYNNGNDSDENKMTLMSSAFKGMISDFQWDSVSRRADPLPRLPSSSSTKSSDSISPLTDTIDETTRNLVYVFFRVPRDLQEMEQFVDDVPEKLDICTSSKQFLNTLVSKAFLQMITRTYQMRVNFVDMWSLHDTEDLESVSYPNSILKVLRHFHAGQVLPATSKMLMVPGLPSWRSLLKSNLKASSAQIPSNSVAACELETTHVSESSRSSTPLENIAGSARKSEDTKRSFSSADRSRLRKDVLVKSQSQSSLPLSQASLKSRPNVSRIQQRFSTGNCSQPILVPKPGNGRPLSRETLNFLRRRSSEGVDAHSVASCPNPKSVRRNLFSGGSREPSEEIKRLLASTAQFNFGRSPARSRSGGLARGLFISPRASASPSHQPEFKSPGSSSVLKSRRRLDMGASTSRCTSLSLSPLSITMGVGYGTASPVQVLSGILCPESPATPPTKRIRSSSFSLPSSEDPQVVPASPEAHHSGSKNAFKTTYFNSHGSSFTFYSTSSSEPLAKSKANREQSGTKMQAARIKDSVDLSEIANTSLSLDDLELLDPSGSPLTNESSLGSAETPLC